MVHSVYPGLLWYAEFLMLNKYGLGYGSTPFFFFRSFYRSLEIGSNTLPFTCYTVLNKKNILFDWTSNGNRHKCKGLVYKLTPRFLPSRSSPEFESFSSSILAGLDSSEDCKLTLQALSPCECGRKPGPGGRFFCTQQLTPGLKCSSTWKRSSDVGSLVGSS